MIRPAELGDLEALVAGNRAMALETEQLELDVTTLREGVKSILEGHAAGRYFVVEEHGQILAQLMITYEWSDWRNRQIWWIQSVYVTPEARGSGRYRALYQHVREEAERCGAAGLRLYVDTRNTSAQAVYTSLGMDGGHYRVFERMFGPSDEGV